MNRRAVARLRELSLLRALPRRALAVVDAIAAPVTFAPGAELCREGAVGQEVFLLTSGEVAVTVDGVEVARRGAGDLVGELALLGSGLRSATVTAVGSVDALVMNRREFSSLLALPGIRDAVTAAAGARAA